MKKHPISTSRVLRNSSRRDAQLKRAAALLSTSFGMSSVEPPPIDVVLMSKLCDALGVIDFDLIEACWQRGLLSSRLVDALRMAKFLSFTLPAARAAQSLTGVPASVLVAEAYLRSGEYSGSNDVFATGKQFSSLMDAFVHRARELNNGRTLKQTMKDRHVSNSISAHDLAECDKLRGSL